MRRVTPHQRRHLSLKKVRSMQAQLLRPAALRAVSRSTIKQNITIPSALRTHGPPTDLYFLPILPWLLYDSANLNINHSVEHF